VRRLAGIAAFILVSAPASAADHVRVVLDVSQSMIANDPMRLATLSTMLLNDLADPDPTRRDTFEVIPFHPTVQWVPGDPAPPTAVGTRIVSDPQNRAAFVAALRALPYQARFTYFYPGLLAAITDLERLPVEGADRRVIVLLTDGVPETQTRDLELERIRQGLIERLRNSGARLYVLAFGRNVARDRSFFDSMAGGGVGDVLIDEGGTRLLEHMIEIFSRSFGYTAERPVALTEATSLDLVRGQTSSEVVTVAYRLAPVSPAFQMQPAGNAPRNVQRADEAGAAYALQWVLQPRSGTAYTLRSDAGGGLVTVLRPTRLRLSVRPARQGLSTDLTIARMAFPLQIVVAPAAGRAGDPGDVHLSFRVCAPAPGSRPPLIRCSTWAPPATAVGTARPDGRAYTIEPTFRDEPDAGSEFYRGHIELLAKRRDAVVGDLSHPVAVYPFVELEPSPPLLTVPESRDVLHSGQRGCARFAIQLAAGQLPHPNSPSYSLRAVVPLAARSDPSFAGAGFSLDGEPLDFESAPKAMPGSWYSGRALAAPVLLGDHELCVQIGRPRGAVATPATFDLTLTFDEPPYDGYAVVARPVAVHVLIAPPGWVERNDSRLAVATALMLVIGLLWYGRSHPYIARDLHGVIGWAKSGQTLDADALAPPSLPARALGLSASRRLLSHTRNTLGRVRPIDAELYQFRAARGVTLEDGPADRTGLLEVHRTYHLQSGADRFFFRIEYE
jgi:hypothetical protein